MPRRAAARALVALALAAAPAVSADGMIKNAEAYWVIDPTDQTCLTELGTFGACDDDALYMYLSRPVGFLDRLLRGTKSRRSLAMVLEPVPRRACLSTKKAHGRTVLGGGDCSSVSRAQQWEMLQSNAKRAQSRTTNEDMVAAVALTTNKQRDCVVRDSSIWSKAARMQRALSGGSSRETAPKGALANTVSVLKCAQRGHTPLELTASNVATSGFLFQAADGAACYDGIRFRACSDEDRSLRWGIGVKFERGRPKTALYKFYNASDSCLVEKGDALVLGSCSQKNALGWGVTRGRLCRNGDCVKSGKCLARSAFDAAAKLFPCKQNVYEHLTLTLDSDGSDAYLLQRLTHPKKRNEDPYLVRVLEPRRKTPHTQRCNEFSKSPIAFCLSSRGCGASSAVFYLCPPAGSRRRSRRPRRASRSRRPRPRRVAAARRSRCEDDGGDSVSTQVFYVDTRRGAPRLRSYTISLSRCRPGDGVSCRDARDTKHHTSMPSPRVHIVTRGGTQGPAPGVRRGSRPRRSPTSRASGRGATTPSSPRCSAARPQERHARPSSSSPARRARRPAAPASGRSGRASASARRATAAVSAARW